MSSLRLNCSTITEAPPEEEEVIWARPWIWPSCFSRGPVTVADMTSALAPG